MIDYIKPLANDRVVVIYSYNSVVRFEVVRPNCNLAEYEPDLSRVFYPRNYSEINAAVSELEYAARKLSDFVEVRPSGCDWMDYAYDLLDDACKKFS